MILELAHLTFQILLGVVLIGFSLYLWRDKKNRYSRCPTTAYFKSRYRVKMWLQQPNEGQTNQTLLVKKIRQHFCKKNFWNNFFCFRKMISLELQLGFLPSEEQLEIFREVESDLFLLIEDLLREEDKSNFKNIRHALRFHLRYLFLSYMTLVYGQIRFTWIQWYTRWNNQVLNYMNQWFIILDFSCLEEESSV